ncbi:MAG: hypothetical protein RMK19_03325 [Bacteroidia bacterium]|nr:hypothetical protein [Bacteroidia bacterium]MDW8015022.1 hypothetical protein [Bacteroidia bacterium]
MRRLVVWTLWLAILGGKLYAQKGIGGFGRVGLGGTYGPHLIGASFRLPLGYSEYTFVELAGGWGQSKAPHLETLQKGYVVGMGMNQGILGGWLANDCGIYWFLPYIDLGARAYIYSSLPQPDGNGGTTQKSVIVPDLYAGIGTLFNVVRHFELFGSIRLRNEVIDKFSPTFSWQVGARVSFGYD